MSGAESAGDDIGRERGGPPARFRSPRHSSKRHTGDERLYEVALGGGDGYSRCCECDARNGPRSAAGSGRPAAYCRRCAIFALRRLLRLRPPAVPKRTGPAQAAGPVHCSKPGRAGSTHSDGGAAASTQSSGAQSAPGPVTEPDPAAPMEVSASDDDDWPVSGGTPPPLLEELKPANARRGDNDDFGPVEQRDGRNVCHTSARRAGHVYRFYTNANDPDSPTERMHFICVDCDQAYRYERRRHGPDAPLAGGRTTVLGGRFVRDPDAGHRCDTFDFGLIAGGRRSGRPAGKRGSRSAGGGAAKMKDERVPRAHSAKRRAGRTPRTPADKPPSIPPVDFGAVRWNDAGTLALYDSRASPGRVLRFAPKEWTGGGNAVVVWCAECVEKLADAHRPIGKSAKVSIEAGRFVTDPDGGHCCVDVEAQSSSSSGRPRRSAHVAGRRVVTALVRHMAGAGRRRRVGVTSAAGRT